MNRENYTHTLIVDALWYSTLNKFEIIEGVKTPISKSHVSRDISYHYEIPITSSEKLLLEKMDIKELHSKTHYEVAKFILDWCFKRYEFIKYKEEIT